MCAGVNPNKTDLLLDLCDNPDLGAVAMISHNLFLLLASITVSLVAAFTGLAITNKIASLPETKRKTLVVMSSFIIGGGIWSMHFVAMLAHQFPAPIYYDLLQTLSSALIAILVVGTAFLLLHFSRRTPRRLNQAGLLLGGGVIVMHYVGIYAVRGVIPQFNFISVVLAVLVAVVAGIIAIRVAYGERNKQNIVLGATVFGLAVVVVHFAAMLGTSFRVDENFQLAPVLMANHTLAVTVTIASFVICGSFLLVATNFLAHSDSAAGADVLMASDEAVNPDINPAPSQAVDSPSIRIPYEKNKKIGLLQLDEVAAARADGHYTQLYTQAGVYFCPWSITEFDNNLAGHGFHRTHRSYIVNIAAVDTFEKRKETGVCMFNNYPGLSTVPVSRNRIIGLMSVLELRANSSGSEAV